MDNLISITTPPQTESPPHEKDCFKEQPCRYTVLDNYSVLEFKTAN